ncbi:PLAC8 family-domain-containing protein [Cryomyces antarcticus]
MTHAVPSAFKHGLCDCCDVSTCLTGLFCPCLLYGRTSHRRSQKAEKKDPTDLLGYSACNGHCTIFALACGLHWMAALLQRMSVRRLYKIEGSFGGDLVESCCCCCCVLVQCEREVRGREERGRLMTGPGSVLGYGGPERIVVLTLFLFGWISVAVLFA